MKHLILHPKQKEIAKSQKRWKVIRAGRKGGKTALEVETIAFKATAGVEILGIKKTVFATGRKVLYIAPTQDQARKIVWEYLKKRFDKIGKSNEQRLEMKVPNQDGGYTTIYVGGYENRENYRGLTDVIHITFDEVDTLRNFFLNWKEIFRPMFLDTGGSADFIGTPKKENPNLKRLEKEFVEGNVDGESFHFTSADNPHLPVEELELMKVEYKNDMESYKQEVLAEYLENAGALFRFTSLVDVFTNTVDKTNDKYLIVDVADDGTDKIKFSYWRGLVEYKRDTFQGLGGEEIVQEIREGAAKERIPFSHIAIDGIGVGAFVAKSSLLKGVICFKGSYSAIKTDTDIVRLPNKQYADHFLAPKISNYKNLRCQCLFILADLVNNHKIASEVTGVDKENIIEELSTYQDASKGDGKKFVTPKEDVKKLIGRSPDDSDTWQMRMYFVIMGEAAEEQDELSDQAIQAQEDQFNININNQFQNNTR